MNRSWKLHWNCWQASGPATARPLSHAEVCRKWDISSTYAYKLKDRAVDTLRKGIGRPAGRASGEVEQVHKRVTDVEQLAGDQALLIRHVKKNEIRR